jgi:hypothetical protein
MKKKTLSQLKGKFSAKLENSLKELRELRNLQKKTETTVRKIKGSLNEIMDPIPP